MKVYFDEMETGYYSIHEKVYVVYGNKGVIMNMKNGENSLISVQHLTFSSGDCGTQFQHRYVYRVQKVGVYKDYFPKTLRALNEKCNNVKNNRIYERNIHLHMPLLTLKWNEGGTNYAIYWTMYLSSQATKDRGVWNTDATLS